MQPELGCSIGLFAGNGVTLESTAKLEAKSTQAGEDGGMVNITATKELFDNSPDLINFKAGSIIDVSGGAGGKGGKVNITAPRTLDNSDIEIAQRRQAITEIANSVKGNQVVEVEDVESEVLSH